MNQQLKNKFNNDGNTTKMNKYLSVFGIIFIAVILLFTVFSVIYSVNAVAHAKHKSVIPFGTFCHMNGGVCTKTIR